MSTMVMRWRRFSALFKARNTEFFRDKASLSWNVIFPVLILLGFSFVFDGDDKSQFKVGLLAISSMAQEHSNLAETHSSFVQEPSNIAQDGLIISQGFLNLRYLEFVNYSHQSEAVDKLRKHQLDLLVAPQQLSYWVNESSPKGYVVEQLLLGHSQGFSRNVIDGIEIRYLDWVVPGILGMNMMFSCLFGVGYVIVRYRKASVLKRLKATPLQPIEFILAQIFSRLFIVVTLTSGVFIATNLMFDFYMLGSYFNLLIIAFVGGLCLISLGLLIASRSRSEELIGGLLNMATWPMMILSGVWFSLEGAPQWLQNLSQAFPLTHVVDAARRIMTDGATLWDLRYSLSVMLIMTAVFLTLSAILFRWEGDGR